MKTTNIELKDNKTGAILDNNELVYLSNDTEKKYPIRRIIRWALRQNAATLNTDCVGMEGAGEFGIDAFWNYLQDSYPEICDELPGDSEFETLLIERFEL